jgi:hypothetical protein
MAHFVAKGVDRRDVHRYFFDYAPGGKQKLFSEHPVCQRLLSTAFVNGFCQRLLTAFVLNGDNLPK